MNTPVGSDLASCFVGHDIAVHFTCNVEECYDPPVDSFACCNVDVATASLPNTELVEAECSKYTYALTTGTNTFLMDGPDLGASTDDCIVICVVAEYSTVSGYWGTVPAGGIFVEINTCHSVEL